MEEDNTNIPVEKDKPTITPAIAGAVSMVLLAIVIILATQNPGTGGPLVILLLLSLIFSLVLLISVLCLRLVARMVRRLPLSSTRILYTSVAVATGAVYLVGLQTLSQLQLIDIVLVLLFELLLNFYLLRRF